MACIVIAAPQSARADCPMEAGAQCNGAACGGQTRSTGAMRHNADYDTVEVCIADGTWRAISPVNCPSGTGCHPCTGGAPPAIGDTCTDGSIYAGLSPDGNVAMYTTPADAPGTYSWNDGSANWVNTAMVNCSAAESSCRTGEANTALLVALNGSGSPAPYDAAEYCNGLSAHGHTDWYLPAKDELNVLYTNKNTGALNGTFNDPSGYYWSSSENTGAFAAQQEFSTGPQNNSLKSITLAIRCVRK